ncbi:unnamed protein product [Anisakis simplex]|uniref:Glutaredoxin-1 (inferred by orthology to a human protein) n=1 Tax=Anisakis simplex TaxID=6269 RepID=A0A0M3K7D3_ANISI|nr:unnamed protein product [Anisakis simplex]
MADLNVEDEELIDAEAASRPRAAYPSLSRIFELYGWYILFIGMLVMFVYKKYVAPVLASITAEKELEERKKHDNDVQARYEEQIRAARERTQARYAANAAREAERQRQKEAERLQKAIEEHGIGQATVWTKSQNASSSSATQKLDPKTFVTNKINSVPVVMFSKSWCFFCRKAKQALSAFRLPNEFYEILEIDEMDECERIQDVLQSISGKRTVPQVFIGGKFIGGGDEVVAALRDGRLKRMLQECGALS